jgi:hypothetical protein
MKAFLLFSPFTAEVSGGKTAFWGGNKKSGF